MDINNSLNNIIVRFQTGIRKLQTSRNGKQKCQFSHCIIYKPMTWIILIRSFISLAKLQKFYTHSVLYCNWKFGSQQSVLCFGNSLQWIHFLCKFQSNNHVLVSKLLLEWSKFYYFFYLKRCWQFFDLCCRHVFLKFAVSSW